jgi:transcriptional regulator with XRE-family HTH domain
MIEPIYLTIGKNIRHQRHRLNMSQSDLAETLGYQCCASISEIELGRSRVQVHMLMDLAAYFHVSLESLLAPNLVTCDLCQDTKHVDESVTINGLYVCKACSQALAKKSEVPV